LVRDVVFSDSLPPIPHSADIRFPDVGLLPVGVAHRTDGPADYTYHACTGITVIEHPRVYHHDVVRTVVAYVYLWTDGPHLIQHP